MNSEGEQKFTKINTTLYRLYSVHCKVCIMYQTVWYSSNGNCLDKTTSIMILIGDDYHWLFTIRYTSRLLVNWWPY